MKTAMQEMIEYLENVYYVKEILDWEDIKKNIIQKEKDQIINAFANGWNWNSDPEKYYKETYQNK
jgi:hypothetical protein